MSRGCPADSFGIVYRNLRPRGWYCGRREEQIQPVARGRVRRKDGRGALGRGAFADSAVLMLYPVVNLEGQSEHRLTTCLLAALYPVEPDASS